EIEKDTAAYLASVFVRLRGLVMCHLRSSADQPTGVPRSCLPSSQIREGHTPSPVALLSRPRYSSCLPVDSSTLVVLDLNRSSRRILMALKPLSAGRARSRSALLAVVLVAIFIPLSLPAVADGDFVDVGGSAHRAAIEYIADRDVTQGCNPPANDRFCPDRPLTRGEMATFLVKAFDLRPSPGNEFRDSSPSVHRRDIEALRAANVT